MIAIYTSPDTEAHDLFCDATLKWAGFVLLNDTLVQIVTMWGAGDGRVEWRLRAVAPVGRA